MKPRRLLLAAVALLACLGQACMGPRLAVKPGGPIEPGLRYDLILYGGRYSGDLHTVAILGIEASPYTIVPYAPSFDYVVIKDLPPGAALAESARFFRFTNPDFIGTRLSRVLGPDGKVAGYEIRPLYQPFTYGTSDVLETSYWYKGHGTISAWIELKPSLRRNGGGQEAARPPGGR